MGSVKNKEVNQDPIQQIEEKMEQKEEKGRKCKQEEDEIRKIEEN